jgi:hypothetical protein
MKINGRTEELLRAYNEGRSLPPADGPSPAPRLKPWYRRAWAWAVEGHKALTGFATVCAISIGAHAWLAGLVTKDNVDATVQAAVTKALVEANGRIKDLEANTRGLPEWRGDTTVHDAVQDTRLQELDKRTASFEDRLERSRTRR